MKVEGWINNHKLEIVTVLFGVALIAYLRMRHAFASKDPNAMINEFDSLIHGFNPSGRVSGSQQNFTPQGGTNQNQNFTGGGRPFSGNQRPEFGPGDCFLSPQGCDR